MPSPPAIAVVACRIRSRQYGDAIVHILLFIEHVRGRALTKKGNIDTYAVHVPEEGGWEG